jgi:hypothetical protein
LFFFFSNFKTFDFRVSKKIEKYIDIYNVVFYHCANFRLKFIVFCH